MADEDEDYSEYVVTTTNPGYLLVWITAGVCILCYVGFALLIRKKGSIEQALQRYMFTPSAQIISNIRPPSSSSRSASGGGPSISVEGSHQNSNIRKNPPKQTVTVNVNKKNENFKRKTKLSKLGRGGKKRYTRVDLQAKAYTKVNCRTKAKEMAKQPKAKVKVKLPKKYIQSDTPLKLEDFTPSYLLNVHQQNISNVRTNPSRKRDLAKHLMDDDESIETSGTDYTVYSLANEKKEVMKLAIP